MPCWTPCRGWSTPASRSRSTTSSTRPSRSRWSSWRRSPSSTCARSRPSARARRGAAQGPRPAARGREGRDVRGGRVLQGARLRRVPGLLLRPAGARPRPPAAVDADHDALPLLETGSEVDIDELETIIECDLGLSQRLLRLSNSAALSPATRVRSLRHALTLLGTRAIRRNATILSLAGIADAPHVVLGTALVRARMAEQLAPFAAACPDRAFTVGLFSLLGALVRRPLPDAARPSCRSTSARPRRCCTGDEPEGRLLRAIVAHERGEALPDGVPAPPRRPFLSGGDELERLGLARATLARRHV